METRGPVPSPGIAPLLTRWQAFGALWRQHWEPAGKDERWLRIFASACSIVLHVLFLVVMAWLLHTRFERPSAAPAQRGDDLVVEVEFIGEGTPDAPDGGAAAEISEQTEEQVADADSEPTPDAAPRARQAPERTPEPEPAPPAPAEQPLEVTQAPVPDTSFVLSPPELVGATSMALPEAALRSRDIEVVEIVEITPPAPPEVAMEAPELALPEAGLAEREIVVPPRAAPVPKVDTPAITPRELEIAAARAREREIPLSSTPGAVSEPVENAEAVGQSAADGQASAPPAPEPGAWPTPQRGDDWGASSRRREGGQAGRSGLFNPDGSPKLPPGTGEVGGGLPPGTIIEDYEQIDRMGTWLKRPPTDYEPTSFDRFWVPSESLLEEWVRRSIRTVLIPIPGTGKSIRCDVVTLALAGGCGIIDPNLMDTESDGRPPPDVPFKPDLQEDQDSLGEGVR